MLRRLFARIALFALPFAVLFVAAIGLAVYNGEAMPLSWVFAAQEADPRVIYFPSEREMIYRYKRFGIQHFRPEVVIFGTSVVRYVRAESFSTEASVYNAYMPAARTYEISRLMHEFTPETAPQVVIVGVDIRRMVRGGSQFVEAYDSALELSIEEILFKSRLTVREVLTGNQTITRLLSQNDGADSQRLGLRATIEGRGFRYDGSMWQHTDAVQLANETRDQVIETERRKLIEAIESGELRVPYRKQTVDLLFGEVARLEAMGVQVIGIVMPFSMPSVIDTLPGTPLDADLTLMRNVISDGFAAANAELFDFFDPHALGLSDIDLPDAVHTTQEVTDRLLADVIQRSPSLRPYARQAVVSRN